MKKSIIMYSLLVAIVGTTPATAQFGKLLDKVKGSGGSKKSGSFASRFFLLLVYH